MAKRFAGFTPEQLGKIVPEMQGMQGDEQAKFLAANPAAAARVGKMAEAAQKRIGMAYGGMVKPKGYATGGQVTLDAAQQKYADAQNAIGMGRRVRERRRAQGDDAGGGLWLLHHAVLLHPTRRTG